MGSHTQNGTPHHAPTRDVSPQLYARIAGILFLLSLLVGVFGEMYVPSKLIVSGDAAATAKNIQTSAWLFRMGFAAYLIEAVCDIGLTWVLYLLLKPVRADIALLVVFFRLVSTASFAFAELCYFSTSHILGGSAYLKTFSPDQLNSLALLALKLYGLGGGIFMVFYGVANILTGYLIFRSGYLPKLLGILLALGGLGFVTRNFALVLWPAYASDVLLLPTAFATIALLVWLLWRGVDVREWNLQAACEETL